ncbi:MAG TPA: hypothetical protein VFT90_18045 [Chryseosolibacter sp.]|nr:hypothetical protein [Chryseosolibacter sp.]
MKSEALPHLFQEELYAFGANVVVVLPKPWQDYGAEEQTLLKKILTSVKVDINAIQMVVQPSIDLRSLNIYSPSRVLLFGVNPNEDIPLYQTQTAQGFTVIRADDLSALDDQKKKNLWLALRQMFGV